jgi:hypothetical protein
MNKAAGEWKFSLISLCLPVLEYVEFTLDDRVAWYLRTVIILGARIRKRNGEAVCVCPSLCFVQKNIQCISMKLMH